MLSPQQVLLKCWVAVSNNDDNNIAHQALIKIQYVVKMGNYSVCINHCMDQFVT